MKLRTLQWLGIALIIETGVVHLYLVPEGLSEASYLGLLFAANAIGSLISAFGIYRGKVWGWWLGIAIALGSVASYAVSRTFGLPGMGIEEWTSPLGLGSLIVEGAFILVFVLMEPRTTLAGHNGDTAPTIPVMEIPIPSRYLLTASSLMVVTLTALFTYQWNARQPGAVLLSQQDLEQRYGLQVTLISSTAMDSIVDVRLKILDADKARTLLEGHHDALALLVDNDWEAMIKAARMSRHGAILKAGGTYITFFPNRQNVVRSGTPVNVVLGNLRLEPIAAQ
jgi:hypothetical protein